MYTEQGEIDDQEVVFLIPVYNTEPHILKNTIVTLHEKIHKRTYIVIVNDGSSKKETINALYELGELEKIRIVCLKKNKGKVRALLHGLEYIEKKFKNTKCVFILDDDVIIKPSKHNSNKCVYDIVKQECRNLNDLAPVVTFPARSQSLSSMLERLQDIEHLLSTHISRLYLHEKFYRNVFSDTKVMNDPDFIEGIWVNGSGSLWLLNELRYVLENHSGVHDGDDLEMGLILRRNKKLIRFSDEIVFYPKLKSTLSDFLKQRIKWIRGAVRLVRPYFNEMTVHYAYSLYVLAPLLLYIDIAGILFGGFIPLLRKVLSVFGIFLYLLIVVSYLRTVGFFVNLDMSRSSMGKSLKSTLFTWRRVLKLFLKSDVILVFLFLILFSFREQVLNKLARYVLIEGFYINLFTYLGIAFASIYLTYKLLTYRLSSDKRNKHKTLWDIYDVDYLYFTHSLMYEHYRSLHHTHIKGCCKSRVKVIIFMNAVLCSAYYLFYVLMVMPIGYVYYISHSFKHHLRKIRYWLNSRCKKLKT